MMRWFEAVAPIRQKTLVAFGTLVGLILVTGLIELVQGVINEVNARFARVENVRRFVLLEKELDHDDGELTATQKVRRGLINKKFARELEIIYGGAQ